MRISSEKNDSILLFKVSNIWCSVLSVEGFDAYLFKLWENTSNFMIRDEPFSHNLYESLKNILLLSFQYEKIHFDISSLLEKGKKGQNGEISTTLVSPFLSFADAMAIQDNESSRKDGTRRIIVSWEIITKIMLFPEFEAEVAGGSWDWNFFSTSFVFLRFFEVVYLISINIKINLSSTVYSIVQI